MNIETGLLISIIVGVVNLLLGVVIFLKNKNKSANRLYFLLSLSIVVWALAVGLGRTAENISYLLFWAKIAYIAAAASALSFLCFSFAFPSESRKLNIFKNIVPLGFFVLLSSWIFLDFNFFITEVRMLNHYPLISNISFVFGKGYTLYSLYIISYFVIGLCNLFLKYKKSEGIIKTQIGYVLWGSSITIALSISSNLLPWAGMLKYNWLGPMFTIVMIVSMAYAIARYHLMNTRVIATELLVALVALVLLIDLLLSKSLSVILFKSGIFVIFIYLGWSLIRSVLKEIKRRQELEKVTLQLKRANVALRKLDKAKSEFISIASHQLRTPLTAIKGYISMILEGSYGKFPKKTQEPMENVYKSNERLIKLVNDLLSVSRIESGKMEMQLEKVSLEDIISSVLKELRNEAKKKGLRLIWEKPKKALPKIMMDRAKIRQVILNVVDNGVRYTKKGRVTIEVKSGKESLLIKLSDTGEGLTKEGISYLFESFARGKAGAKFWAGGAGLGLYVAKKFIEMHDGKIWAESEGKGKGSTFYVELPIK